MKTQLKQILAAIIGLAFGWVLGVITMADSLGSCRDSSAKIQRKLDDAEHANLTEKLDHLKEISQLLNVVLHAPQDTKPLDHGAISLEMSIGSLEEMQKQQPELQREVTFCIRKNGPCVPELLDRIKIKKGSTSNFLVIEGLTSPMASALYDYFWNNSNSSWTKSGPDHGVYVMYGDKLPWQINNPIG